MKKLLLALITVFSISSEVQASHGAGGSIWYEYIGDSTGVPYHYRINMELLRRNETGSQTLASSYQIQLNSSCYGFQNITLQRITPPAYLDAGDGGFLPEPKSNCSNANTTDSNWINISIHLYQGSWVLPGACSDYIFSYSQCCLNTSITNLQNPTFHYIYLDSRLNNTLGPNTSPRFEVSPVLSYCLNKPTATYFSAVEPDGDSLYYELAHPWTAYNQPIPFDSAYSRYQPITTLNGVFFDSITGVMSFTPTNIENDVVKVKAREYRLDTITQTYKFIGVTSRQIQSQIVATCDTTSLEWSFVKDSLSFGASINPNCLDSAITFKTKFAFLKSSLAANGSDFYVIDVDAGNVPIPVISASTSNTGTSLFADEVKLHLNQAIQHDGDYMIISKTGTDTNTILSICNTPMPSNDTVFFKVTDCQSGFGIDEKKLTALHLYPSPAKNTITVELPLSQTLSNWKYTIYDIQGKVLSADDFDNNVKGAQSINISGLPAGFYNIRLSDGREQTYSGKFVKK